MEDFILTDEEKRDLLRIARKTIEEYLDKGTISDIQIKSDALREKRGVFVSLHRKGQLRGCIGNLVSEKPLFQTVMDMAIASSFEDPRFPPLTKKELPEIDIEISVLGPLKKIKSVEEIRIGKHGLYIVRGPFRGVLLPQVATEYGWNAETFLDHTCMKAGLEPGCWKKPGTEIYLFEAEVFEEKDFI